VLASLLLTRRLAVRIRQAYLRQRPWWSGAELTGSVWAAAATTLYEAHQLDPRAPLDPELFVAAQVRNEAVADPWKELASPEAVRRYRRRVVRMIQRLRRELRRELRRIDRQKRRGQSLEQTLNRVDRHLSPLGRYVAAIRAGRSDLADHLRAEALHQHQSCPLYRWACQGLLPDEFYPATARTGPWVLLPTELISHN